jgi:hypothetical protein
VFDDEMLVVLDPAAKAVDETYESRQERLTACLEKLPALQRELLRQRYADGLSLQAIAESVRRTANAVAQTLFRVRHTLIECVTRLGDRAVHRGQRRFGIGVWDREKGPATPPAWSGPMRWTQRHILRCWSQLRSASVRTAGCGEKLPGIAEAFNTPDGDGAGNWQGLRSLQTLIGNFAGCCPFGFQRLAELECHEL